MVRNASPHTLRSYRSDLEQFREYLSPPGAQEVPLREIDHRMIREFLGHLHDRHLQKRSMARKLASLRSLFKFCAREGLVRDNPARLVATPKLPIRIPAVLSAEEMNTFLDQLASGDEPAPRRPLEVQEGSPACCCSATAPYWNCCTLRACGSAS